MPNHAPTIESLVATLGFCCLGAFFAANAKIRTGLLADLLGCDLRTLRRHRQWWKARYRGCMDRKTCIIKSAPAAMQLKLKRRIG